MNIHFPVRAAPARACQSLLLLLLAIMGAVMTPATSAGTRYEQPLRDPLYFNEVLAAGESKPLPVRFPRLGRHYAELILEPSNGASDVVLTAPLEVRLQMTFRRLDRVVAQRETHVQLQPGERGKTLFFFDVPGDLPNRADLTLQIALEAPAEPPGVGGFRLQIRRKLDFGPLPLWR